MTKVHNKYSGRSYIEYDQYLYEIGSWHYNWHPELEILWVLKGQVEVNLGDVTFTLDSNDMMGINPNVGRTMFASMDSSIALQTYIPAPVFKRNGLSLRENSIVLNSHQNKNQISFDNIRHNLACLNVLDSSVAINKLHISANFLNLIDVLSDFLTVNEQYYHSMIPKISNHNLGGITKFIEEHFRESISLDVLAKMYNYSPAYLSRLIKEILGVNFYEYLTRCRLRQTVRDLSTSPDKISDIAYQNGFSDLKAFNLSFKKHLGSTPSNYRRRVSRGLRVADLSFQQPLPVDLYKQIMTILIHYT